MEWVYWVIPGLLAGRPGPDEIDWNLTKLYDGGFRAILTLHGAGVDSDAVRRSGFIHSTLLLPDSIPPSKEDILIYEKLVPEALRLLKEHVSKGIPTLVHCHSSKDRTCVVMVCYLCLIAGMAWAEAVRRVRMVKPNAFTAEGYETLSKHLVDELRGSSAGTT